MDFDETELEVAQVLVQLPHLIFDFEIQRMFPLAWGSKKQRRMSRIAPLSGGKTPVSFPNSKLRITLKRKRSENRHQSSSRFGGTKGRSCFCAVKDESSKKKKVSRRSSNSSAAFLIPDLNLPPLFEQEAEENCYEHEAHKPTLCLRA